MTIEVQRWMQVGTAPAVFRYCSDHGLDMRGAVLSVVMQGIPGFPGATCLAAYRVANALRLGVALCEPGFGLTRGNQNESSPTLRHPKIGNVQYITGDAVAVLGEAVGELVEQPVVLQTGDVLHQHEARLGFVNQAQEFKDEVVPVVIDSRLPVLGAKSRKPLTGRASRQQIEFANAEVGKFQQLRSSCITDIATDNRHAREVHPITFGS